MAVWGISIQTSHLNLGDYGLITSLNVAYWVSLGLLFASFALLLIFRGEVRWLLAAQTIFLVVVLYLTPYLMENMPRLTTGFPMYADADYVINHGHLSAATITYHNWPGYSLITAQTVIVLKIDSPMLIMGLFPFLVKLAGLLPLYLLFRSLSVNNHFVIAAAQWIYCLGFWVNQDYASPQAIGLFLLLLFSALIVRVEQVNPQRILNTNFALLQVIVFFSIVLTQAFTSFAALTIAVAVFFMSNRRGINLVILLVIVLIAWSLYGAATQFRFFLPIYWQEAFRLDKIFDVNFTEGFAGSGTRKIVSWTRVLFTLTVGFLALTGFLLTWLQKKWQKADTTALALAIGAALILPISYGYELFHRMYIYNLAPLSQFGGKLAGFGKYALVVIIAVFAVFLPVHVLTRYGSEQLALNRSPDVAAQTFFFDNTTNGYIIGGGNYLTFKRPESYAQAVILENHWNTQTQDFIWAGGYFGGSVQGAGRERYVCIAYYDELAYSRFSAVPDIILQMKNAADASPRYNLVYTNPDVVLYHYSVY